MIEIVDTYFFKKTPSQMFNCPKCRIRNKKSGIWDPSVTLKKQKTGTRDPSWILVDLRKAGKPGPQWDLREPEKQGTVRQWDPKETGKAGPNVTLEKINCQSTFV